MQQNADSDHLRSRLKKFRFLIVVPYVIGVLISLFAPLDVLKYEFPDFIYRCASAIFPAVRQMKGEYDIGQVSKLYFSTMWLFCPAMFWYFCLDINSQIGVMVPRCSKHKYIFVLFYYLCIPSAILFTVFVNQEFGDMYSLREYLTMRSRIGMNFFGFVIPSGACALGALLYFAVNNFKAIFCVNY